MTSIPVKKEMLVWARELRGLTVEEAAEKLDLDVEKLLALEDGTAKLNLTQYRNYAQKLRIPLGTLLRRTPPPVPPLPRDFRTFEGRGPTVGFETRLAISYAYMIEQNVLELVEAEAAPPTPFLPKIRLAQDPAMAGEQERMRLGVTAAKQLGWSGEQAFRCWRTIIELSGVFVLQQKFELDDCRGFTIFRDANVPIIMLNKNERFDTAKSFTLAHEYCHLLLRQPGLSDLSDGNNVEAYCNRFAGGFLMPRTLLMEILPFWPDEAVMWDFGLIATLARRLKVSQQALALRLEQVGVAPKGFFARLVIDQALRQAGGNGGNYNSTQVSEIGYRFASLVLGAAEARHIGSAEASEMLAIAPRYFAELKERLDQQFINVGAGADGLLD